MSSPANAIDRLRTAEHEARAAVHVVHALDNEKTVHHGINTAAARLIAATLHEGAGTALEQFAGRGLLDVEQALAELDRVPAADYRRHTWIAGLWDYLERRHLPRELFALEGA